MDKSLVGDCHDDFRMRKLLRDASTQRPAGQCEGRDGVGKFAALPFVWDRSLLLPRLWSHHPSLDTAPAAYRVTLLGRRSGAMDMCNDAHSVVVRFRVARGFGRPAFPSSAEVGEQGRRCRAILTSKHVSLAGTTRVLRAKPRAIRVIPSGLRVHLRLCLKTELRCTRF
jgi:hypothetical protein